MNKIFLATTKTCTQCPIVKSAIESKGLREQIDYVDAEEQPDLMVKYELMSVPSLIDERDPQNPKVYVGAQKCLQGLETI